MMNKRYFGINKGFTLIEVILTLAIVGIVIAGAFSMLSFGNKAVSIGEKQYDVQNGVRVASDIITDELRFAKEIEIVNPATIPNPVTDDNRYILLNGAQAVECRSKDGSRYTAFGLTAGLSFKKVGAAGNEKIINFYIMGKDNEQDFEISTEVKPLNFHLEPGNAGILGLNEGFAVRYEYPDSSGGAGGAPVVNAAPYADGLSISGTLKADEEVTGGYSYHDAEGDLQGASTYKWYRSPDKVNKVLINLATHNTYTISADDKGYYICFEVIPVASTGTKTGAAVSVVSDKKAK